MTFALGACDEGPVQTASVSAIATPDVADVLYPTRDGSLLVHDGMSHLPADTAWVVVADVPALLAVAPFGDLLAADAEPYDEIIEAASVHAAGVVLGREVEHLRTAGLDLSSPWGMASIDGSVVLFGKVSDGEALRARVHKRAKKEKVELTQEDLGEGTLLTVERSHALWLVDGLAYLIQGPWGRGQKVARRLAETPEDKSLASQPHFVSARDRVGFGEHAAAYVSLTNELKALSLKHDVAYLENRYDELEKWVKEQRASSGPIDDDTKDKLAEVEARLKHRQAEMARVQARQERVKALPEQIGIAMGIDVHLATVRGKAFLPLPDDLARDLFSSTTVASRDRPTTTSDDIVEPVTTLARWDLRLSPRAALEVAIRTMGTTDARALYRWLGGATAPENDPVLPLLSGAVARSYHEVEGKTHVRLELGLAAGAGATVRGWLDRVDADAPDVPVVREDDRLHLSRERGDVFIEVRNDALVLAGHESLLGPSPTHPKDGDPDLVASLGVLPESDGLVSLPAASFISSTTRLFGSPLEELMAPSPMSFAMLGGLGRPSRSSSSKEVDEMERKRKRLEKRRAKVRGELATLRSRHRVEARSGRSRLLTALGTSVARVHPETDGVTFFFAQRIAETDMAALAEHAAYALVDSSSESETAQRIRELEEKAEALDEQLMEVSSVGFVSAISSMPAFSNDDLLMNVMADERSVGLGPAPGGGGTAVGLGGLGTKETGSGRTGGGSSVRPGGKVTTKGEP